MVYTPRQHTDAEIVAYLEEMASLHEKGSKADVKLAIKVAHQQAAKAIKKLAAERLAKLQSEMDKAA